MLTHLKQLGTNLGNGVKAVFAKALDIISTVVGVVLSIGALGLIGYTYFTSRKDDSQKALDENTKDQAALANIDTKIAANTEQEQMIQTQIKKDDQNVSTEELINYFNNSPTDPNSKS